MSSLAEHEALHYHNWKLKLKLKEEEEGISRHSTQKSRYASLSPEESDGGEEDEAEEATHRAEGVRRGIH